MILVDSRHPISFNLGNFPILGWISPIFRILPQFIGELLQFSGKLTQTQRERIENVPRRQRIPLYSPNELRFAPEIHVCVHNNKTLRKSVIIVYQLCVALVCKLLTH